MHLACRLCVLTKGLKGSEVGNLPKTADEFVGHLKAEHGITVTPEALKVLQEKVAQMKEGGVFEIHPTQTAVSEPVTPLCFCRDHWARLRAALDLRGLTPLIKKGLSASAGAWARQQEGRHDSPDDFDPLMSAHMAIVAQAVERLGNLTWSSPCSLCAVLAEATRPGPDEVPRELFQLDANWINGASNDALAWARKYKWVPEAS